ncbi:MAG: RHS repeat-associated core domain-containing protein, partial [Planctomycetaceae bacterium]
RGNVLAYVDRNGRRTQWAYDPLGRTASEQWLTGETLAYTLQYTYDVGSRVTVAQDPVSRYSYVYNQNDQVTKVTSANAGAAAVVLDSVYDLLGRRTELKATVAGKADFRNTYQYDSLSRMTQVAQQAQVSTNPVQQKRVNYAYTPASDRRQVTRWADVAGTKAVATSDWVYDAGGRLLELTHRANTTGAVLNAYRWSYDALSRPVSESSSDGLSTWQYDATSQVTAADHTRLSSERYTYDATGNRTAATQATGSTGTITTGANNRLLEDDRYRYEYDAKGNRTSRTELATGNYQRLTWDHRNLLTAVTSHSSTGTQTSQVTYSYDLHDRRISRSVDADGNGTFETVQRFAYDGSDLVLTFSGSTNRLTNRYLHGPGIDEILADEQISATGAATVIWSLADRLGTVRDLVQHSTTTGTTTLVNHIQYDTFGQLLSQTNPTQPPWFGNTGREWDAAAGLSYYRARWYDPRAGRFISEDPLSFAAGDVNRNRYVGNGATLWVDPSGMAGQPSQDDMASAMMAPLAWAQANNAVPKGAK